jgi:hypothetical protein
MPDFARCLPSSAFPAQVLLRPSQPLLALRAVAEKSAPMICANDQEQTCTSSTENTGGAKLARAVVFNSLKGKSVTSMRRQCTPQFCGDHFILL